MTIGADFWVGLKLFFTDFTKIFALLSAGDAVFGEDEVDEFHRWSIHSQKKKYTEKTRTKAL